MFKEYYLRIALRYLLYNLQIIIQYLSSGFFVWMYTSIGKDALPWT